VDVVGGVITAIPLVEPVVPSCRPVGVGRDVLPDAAGPPLGVRSDLDRGAGQEVLRPEDEGVVGLVTIESLG
jgi:hypothetical protein